MTTATRKCSYKPCGVRFHRIGGIVRGLMAWCCEEHQAKWAIEAGRKLLHRQQREAEAVKKRQNQEAKQRLKSKGDWLREAQAVFNAYIRERDRNAPCISCQRPHQGQYHAGHYRSVGSCPQLRFEPRNVHKQCAPCNDHLSGNLVDYRKNLILKLGGDVVDWLEGPHELKHYTIEDIKSIKAHYKLKLQLIQKGCIAD